MARPDEELLIRAFRAQSEHPLVWRVSKSGARTRASLVVNLLGCKRRAAPHRLAELRRDKKPS